MAKKNSENAPESGNPTAEVGDTADGPTLAPRLSVQLTDTGAIAWDRMRPETQERLRKALGPVASGTAQAAPGATTGGFDAGLCGVLYDALSVGLVGFAKSRGVSESQAAIVAITPEEKAQLVPPTVAVLNKYNATLGKYQEEMVLAVLVTTILSGKLALLRATPVTGIPHRVGEETIAQAVSQEQNRVL